MPKNINALIVSDNERFVRMLTVELARIGISGYTGERELLENIPEEITLVLADLDACDDTEHSLLEKISRMEHISLLVGWSRTAEERLTESTVGYVMLRRPFHMSLLISLISERVLGVKTADILEEVSRGKSMTSAGRVYKKKKSEPAEKRLATDPEKKAALYGDEIISLSEHEYRVLELLLAHRGEPVSREQISLAVGSDRSNMGDVYICRLRTKLDGRFGIKLIYTVRGKGYMLK